MIDRLQLVCPVCKLLVPVRSRRSKKGWVLLLEPHTGRNRPCSGAGRPSGSIAPPPPGPQIRLHVVLEAHPHQDPPRVIAHCLELDLRTGGPDIRPALDRLVGAIRVVCQESQSAAGPLLPLQPAPQAVWAVAARAVPVSERRVRLPGVPSIVLVALWPDLGRPRLPARTARGAAPPWMRREPR